MVWNVTQMGIATMVSSKIINHMAKEFTLGSMEKFMKARGEMGSKKAKACGREYLGTLILASGYRARLMGTVCTSGRTEIDLKANGKCA